MKEGNINGITKFKLFLPETKKNPDEEIIITEIYRALNILAPRTFFINVDNQSNDYLALFQEKTEKEFLEFNHRKESVILEGDERYIFDVNEKDFGWESKLISLAKVSNENLLDKSPDYRDILLNSLSNLNKFYLNTKNYYEHYELFPYNVSKTDNEYLNKSDFLDHESNFGIFNSLIFATNSQHALVPHNRKFYWNKEYQTFEPIYYDGNINIHERLDKKSFPKNAKFFKHASETLNLFNKLDNKSVIQKIKKNFNVININDKQINLKIEKIRFNLNEIINFQEIKVTKKPLIEFDNYKTNLENYFSRLGNKKILPIFIDEQFNNFYKCNKNHCDLIKFNNDELKLLINGSLKKNKNFYQFVGVEKIENFKIINKKIFPKNNFKSIDFQNSKIVYKNDDFLIQELSSNTIKIKQLIPNSKMMITGGSLRDLKILANFISQEKNSNEKSFGTRGLTGCLNLIDLDIKNVDIEIINSNCEDGLNIIRGEGSIHKLAAVNSSNDALDIDFSNIIISNVNILSAGNDCVDLSYGKYKIIETNIKDCSDKAISVGENSQLDIKNLNVLNSDTGIASKDSSKSKIENGFFKDLNTCLAVYNKKQEFLGGLIVIKNFDCVDTSEKFFVDNVSSIDFIN